MEIRPEQTVRARRLGCSGRSSSWLAHRILRLLQQVVTTAAAAGRNDALLGPSNLRLSPLFRHADDHGVGLDELEHLVLALRREFQKAGRLRTPEEFGPYYHLVTGDGDVAAAR